MAKDIRVQHIPGFIAADQEGLFVDMGAGHFTIAVMPVASEVGGWSNRHSHGMLPPWMETAEVLLMSVTVLAPASPQLSKPAGTYV